MSIDVHSHWKREGVGFRLCISLGAYPALDELLVIVMLM
jgi:hypothetical protein